MFDKYFNVCQLCRDQIGTYDRIIKIFMCTRCAYEVAHYAKYVTPEVER